MVLAPTFVCLCTCLFKYVSVCLFILIAITLLFVVDGVFLCACFVDCFGVCGRWCFSFLLLF